MRLAPEKAGPAEATTAAGKSRSGRGPGGAQTGGKPGAGGPAERVAGGKPGSGSPAERVAGLLDSIDMELLAAAASQCGAHARALLYFESHVRAKEQGTLNPVALSSSTYADDDVSFFQVRSCFCAACPLCTSVTQEHGCSPVWKGHTPTAAGECGEGAPGLQEVYGKLEEPDGLSGMVQLRSGGPRLKDQVSCSQLIQKDVVQMSQH